MKKFALLAVCLIVCVVIVLPQSISNTETTTTTVATSNITTSKVTTTKNYNYTTKKSDSSYFSNDYGSKYTKCMKSGCDNYIASSGDTAYCTSHSNKCLECRCYIDGDAMYCMSCLYKAADSNKDYGGSYSSNNDCYICGSSAYSKYGSYYYCSDCLDLVKAFSY